MSTPWVRYKFNESVPKKEKEYLVTCKNVVGNGYSFMFAYWTHDIGKQYPFYWEEEYGNRVGGGWIVADSEGDWELTGVEYYMEIPELPKEE